MATGRAMVESAVWDDTQRAGLVAMRDATRDDVLRRVGGTSAVWHIDTRKSDVPMRDRRGRIMVDVYDATTTRTSRVYVDALTYSPDVPLRIRVLGKMW